MNGLCGIGNMFKGLAGFEKDGSWNPWKLVKNVAEINSKKNEGMNVDSIFGGMDMPIEEDTSALNMDKIFA